MDCDPDNFDAYWTDTFMTVDFTHLLPLKLQYYFRDYIGKCIIDIFVMDWLWMNMEFFFRFQV